MLPTDFPLYTEAIKFYKNREKMVRIAVRVVTLNVYSVNDPDLRKFVLNRSAVPFFLNLVWFIRDHVRNNMRFSLHGHLALPSCRSQEYNEVFL